VRGDLSVVPDSATSVQTNIFFPANYARMRNLTLSELNTKSRRWWCSSKGERRANTIAIAKVAMLIIMIAFARTRRENRCEKGVTSGTVIDSTSVTRDAMICSAGASAPNRPVYD
jgi:hypothetical protein